MQSSGTRQLIKTAEKLQQYGFGFWADKLYAIQQASSQKNPQVVLAEVAKLYGGFGTLMDLAVDPARLPIGVSEGDANNDLLKSINALYDHVKFGQK